MRCNWCGEGIGRKNTRDKTGKIYFYYCIKCIGTIQGEIGIEGKKLIEEFLPHLEWALNELYPTHYNNVKYQIHNNYYIKLKKRLK